MDYYKDKKVTQLAKISEEEYSGLATNFVEEQDRLQKEYEKEKQEEYDNTIKHLDEMTKERLFMN